MPYERLNHRSRLSTLVFAIFMALSAPVLAQNAEPIWPKLTPKLQLLLQEEMLSIHEASQEILTAMIEGNGERVAELAQQIHDSFILQRSMTPEDKSDLMNSVPEEFVKMDRRLHEISAELAQAARQDNKARQHEMFGRMIGACSACHAEYATDRFPLFIR